MCLSEAAAGEVMKSKYLQVRREILQSQAVPAAVLPLHHNHLLQVPRQGLLAGKRDQNESPVYHIQHTLKWKGINAVVQLLQHCGSNNV